MDRVLFSDRPLEDPEKDELGYAVFAHRLALSIRDMFNPEGFVIAINARWGSGKTSFLNFVEHYLKTESDLTIVKFNPWWFSGRDDLTKQFFNQMGFGISDNMADAIDLAQIFGNYVASTGGVIGVNLSQPFTQTANFIRGKVDPRQMSVEGQKEQIVCKLSKKGRILVIVDDLDRLSAEEIIQMFQVIKGIANFPNVVYLLAFAKDVVGNVVKRIQDPETGEKYLEKIIQVSFDLPPPKGSAIHGMLYQNLEEILDIEKDDLFDEYRWGEIYSQFIQHVVQTPRDVIRITNALRVTYPSVHQEVNPIDFIGMEAIRLFKPDIFEAIRVQPKFFLWSPSNLLDFEKESYQKFFASLLEGKGQSEKNIISNAIKTLFPTTAEFLPEGKIMQSTPSKPKLRRELRICHPGSFPTYIWMAVPDYAISQKEMDLIVSSIEVPGFLSSFLLDQAKSGLSGFGKVTSILTKLEDYFDEDKISDSKVPAILSSLYDVGDELALAERDIAASEFHGAFGSRLYVDYLTQRLLSALEDTDRFKLLMELTRTSRSLYLPTLLIYGFQRMNDKQSEWSGTEQYLLEDAQVAQLKSIVVSKIYQAANDGSLIDVPYLPFVLDKWYQWCEDRKACEEWVVSVVKNDDLLLKKLEQLRSPFYSDDRVFFRIDPKNFEPYVDLSWVYNRVCELESKLDDYSVTPVQKETIEMFKKSYLTLVKRSNEGS